MKRLLSQARSPGRGRRARGQALILALAWLACAIGCYLLSYEVGEVLNAKQRLVSAADAATFSAVAFEARVLNFESYVNRAVVANEAAVAHALTLSSWLDYVDRTVSRADYVARFVPYLAQVSAVLRSIAESANATIQPILMPVPGMLSGSSALLAASAEALHSAVPLVVPDLIDRNLALNDTHARLSPLGYASLSSHLVDWSTLSQRYEGGERVRLADLIHRSRDPFSSQRVHGLSVGGVVRVEKRGGTDLVTYDSWRAMDTLAAHVQTPVGSEELSLGWGASSAGRLALARGGHGRSHDVNPRTSRRALRDSRRSASYRGLPALRDVRPAAEPKHAELTLHLEVMRDPQHVPSSRRELGALGAVHSESAPLLARASARVFHERLTPRSDSGEERGSLYSPYWHARLALQETP